MLLDTRWLLTVDDLNLKEDIAQLLFAWALIVLKL